MLIHAICVCVDYSGHLAKSISRWVPTLSSLTVVTCDRDNDTKFVARDAGANLFITEAFYEQGAYFNKGRAMQQARERIPQEGWHLFIDADVVPPLDWFTRVVEQEPRRGNLYGARRVTEVGGKIPDRELAGFFQLFHSEDPRAKRPLHTNFLHAGNYDSEFMLRWMTGMRIILNLELTHYGEVGRNWCGVGNDEILQKIREERRNKDWRTEVVK